MSPDLPILEIAKELLELEKTATEILKPIEGYQIALKNGGLHTLAYDLMCEYVGPDHQSRCESIIRDCMLIARFNGDIQQICEALVEAAEAMRHAIDSTSGYTGGKPQEWLKKWGGE